jgi:hypothetical protein
LVREANNLFELSFFCLGSKSVKLYIWYFIPCGTFCKKKERKRQRGAKKKKEKKKIKEPYQKKERKKKKGK